VKLAFFFVLNIKLTFVFRYFCRMKYDAGIIGAGVAGSSMAIRLAAAGYRVLVFSQAHEQDSSRVAAGLLNPFAPRHLIPGWYGLEFAHEAHAFYNWLQKQTGITFYNPSPIFRIFPNAHYRSDWQKRYAEYPEYLSPAMAAAPDPHIQAPLGGGILMHSGVADGSRFLQAAAQVYTDRIHVIRGKADYEQLEFKDAAWHYGDVHFTHVLFCEGLAARENPHLKNLLLSPLKGDLLRVRMPGFDPKYIYQTRQFIVPDTEPGVFKTGSTYKLWDHSTEPLQEDRDFLLEALQDMYSGPYEILQHQAGLRPSSYDRRPYAGAVPSLKQAWVLNGLGSKGYLMTPLLSRMLSDAILQGKPLWHELNPARRKKGLPVN